MSKAGELFDKERAWYMVDWALSELIVEVFGESGWEDYGYDDYDTSVEIYGVPPDFRLTLEQVQKFLDFGFNIVFVNHKDGNETHYTNSNKAGWRSTNVNPTLSEHRKQRQNRKLQFYIVQAHKRGGVPNFPESAKAEEVAPGVGVSEETDTV